MLSSKRNIRFSFRNLTPQLFVLIILPLTIVLFAIAFGGTKLHQQAMRALVSERDERAVRAAAQTLNEQLNHRATAIRTLALRVREEMETSDLKVILETNQFPPPEFDLGLAFLARGGAVLTFTGDPALWENFDAASDSEMKSLFSRDAPPTFVQLTHPISGEAIVLVTAPAYKGGPLAVGAFSVANIAHRTLASVFTAGEGAAAFVVDADYRVLYQIGELMENDSPSTGVTEALAGNVGATYVKTSGNEHVVAYSPVEPIGWAIVIEEPWEAVTSPLLRTTENAPLVLAPALLLAVIAVWFGIRQIVQPLQALEVKAAEVGWGKFESIEEPVGGIAEIQRLQTELIHLAHKVKAAQQGLRGYIGAMTTGQEEERRRLARELHDDTLQALIALNQRVQLARLSLNGEEAGEQLAEIQQLTNQTIVNLRRITRALRPTYLEDLGLVAALETLAHETERTAGFKVDFRVRGEQRRLTPLQELALYRMAQEALSNVVRHAQASHCILDLHFGPRVTLTVRDDGRGFTVPESLTELTTKGHFGLLGLHERAQLIGAQLEITSTPGEGTRIAVRLSAAEIEKDKGTP